MTGVTGEPIRLNCSRIVTESVPESHNGYWLRLRSIRIADQGRCDHSQYLGTHRSAERQPDAESTDRCRTNLRNGGTDQQASTACCGPSRRIGRPVDTVRSDNYSFRDSHWNSFHSKTADLATGRCHTDHSRTNQCGTGRRHRLPSGTDRSHIDRLNTVRRHRCRSGIGHLHSWQSSQKPHTPVR